MSAPLLSIVMPVYNVAPYLPRCLESLAALNPPADEIIVVDDGSTDACPTILAEFAPRLPQMRVIRQVNGGLSAARNTGLAVAQGQFLAFVDSDDYVEPDAYAEALKRAEVGCLDMVLFNARFHYEGRKPDQLIYSDIRASGVISGRDWLRQQLRAGRFLHMVWLHLYRREFIESNGFRFIPNLIHEDVIWTTRALLAAQRAEYLPKVSVNYRIPIRNMTAEARQRRLEAVVESSIVNARTEAEMADTLADDPELRSLLSNRLVDGALSIFHLLPKMPNRASARRIRRNLRTNGLLALLWCNAGTLAQRRRIAKQYLLSFI